MTAPGLFAGSKLKIKRANQHIDELNSKLNAFIQTDFYTLSVEEDSTTGQHTLKLGVITPLPECLPLIIGDTLHNLRTALDFMASEIVRRAGGSSDYIKFPVRKTRKEVEAAINGGEIKVASQNVISAILNEVKPYKGGNNPLCALHDLDITDKHLLLIPVVSVVALTHVNGRAGGMTLYDCTFEIVGGGEFRILKTPAAFEFLNHGQPMFSILFDKGPFEGEPCVPTLYKLAQLVVSIVQTIEKAYVANS